MDHINNGHNFYLYKQPNGKWIYLSYDFDLDFGIFLTELLHTSYTEFFNKNVNLLNILIFKDPKRFEKVLNEVIQSTINPSTLYPYIDELKKFIEPYVVIDKTPDANGRLSGRLNKQGFNIDFSLEQWEAFSEFTSNLFFECGYIYGLKYWILMKYRLACNNYGYECDPIYMDEDFKYPVNEKFNFLNEMNNDNGDVLISRENIGKNQTSIPTETETSIPTKTSIPTETATNNVLPTAIPEDPSKENLKCLAELIGYTRCSDKITQVYDHDEYGDWGYDFYNQIWCGLSPYEESSNVDDECWSEIFGYSCCKGCKVYEIDASGSWGYELNQWCGIPSFCQSD